jgi:hypothetical protein
MITPDEWQAFCEAAEADIAAGHCVPLADIIAELDAAADELEARLRANASAQRNEIG